MFKHVFMALVIGTTLFTGFFGMPHAQEGVMDSVMATDCGHGEQPCEPMSQACAAHCLFAAIARSEAPVVSPELFSVLLLFVVTVAGWRLFVREDSEGLLGFLRRLGLLGFSNRLQLVRSTVFRE